MASWRIYIIYFRVFLMITLQRLSLARCYYFKLLFNFLKLNFILIIVWTCFHRRFNRIKRIILIFIITMPPHINHIFHLLPLSLQHQCRLNRLPSCIQMIILLLQNRNTPINSYLSLFLRNLLNLQSRLVSIYVNLLGWLCKILNAVHFVQFGFHDLEVLVFFDIWVGSCLHS